MDEAGRVVAVVHDHGDAVAMQEELTRAGIVAEVVHPRPGRYLLEDESFREHLRAGLGGLAVGMALGALVGLALALGIPALRDLGPTAQLVLVYGVALQVTMPIVMWRIGRVDHDDDDAVQTCEVQAGDELVVAHDAHREQRSRRIISGRAGEFLQDVAPVRPAA